jgi:hypothetical protein
MRLILSVFLICLAASASALTPVAPGDVTLDGRWTVNTTLSDDGEKLLQRRMADEMKEQRRYEERRRKRMENDPFAWEPEFSPPADTPQYRARMADRDRAIKQMLGLTKFLNIKQTDRGAKVEIVSEFETRRLTSGARSQVSMPQGQLADLKTGWERDAFVIERSARDGPRISEKYRWLAKTNQLEVLTTIKGDSMLSGMKLRRVFDRAPPETAPASPTAGPTR